METGHQGGHIRLDLAGMGQYRKSPCLVDQGDGVLGEDPLGFHIARGSPEEIVSKRFPDRRGKAAGHQGQGHVQPGRRAVLGGKKGPYIHPGRRQLVQDRFVAGLAALGVAGGKLL